MYNVLIERMNYEIGELKDDSCTVLITLSRHELRMIRDALTMNDAVLEASFKILNNH